MPELLAYTSKSPRRVHPMAVATFIMGVAGPPLLLVLGCGILNSRPGRILTLLFLAAAVVLTLMALVATFTQIDRAPAQWTGKSLALSGTIIAGGWFTAYLILLVIDAFGGPLFP